MLPESHSFHRQALSATSSVTDELRPKTGLIRGE